MYVIYIYIIWYACNIYIYIHVLESFEDNLHRQCIRVRLNGGTCRPPATHGPKTFFQSLPAFDICAVKKGTSFLPPIVQRWLWFVSTLHVEAWKCDKQRPDREWLWDFKQLRLLLLPHQCNRRDQCKLQHLRNQCPQHDRAVRESPCLQSCLLWMMLPARTAKPPKFVLPIVACVLGSSVHPGCFLKFRSSWTCCEDDYFDPASGAWDVDGLKDDLRLAKAPWMKNHLRTTFAGKV